MMPIARHPAETCHPRRVYLAHALPLTCLLACLPAVHAFGPVNTTGLQIDFSATGRVSLFRDTITGVNRVTSISRYQKPFVQLRIGSRLYDPTGFARSGGRLTYTFATLSPTRSVTVELTSRTGYIVAELTAVSAPAGIDEVRFVNIFTQNSLSGAIFRLLRYDDHGVQRYAGICPLDPYTQTTVGPAGAGGYLWARAYQDLPAPTSIGFTGRKVALFTCAATPGALYDLMDRIERDHGIPLGVRAKLEPAQRRSCFFWMDLRYEQRQAALQYMQQAGVGRALLLHSVWGDPLHRYRISDRWPSPDALRDWISQCRSAGILVGAHTLPAKIRRESIDYVAAGLDPRIWRDRTLTLARPLPASQTTGLIETTTPPTGWPTASGQREAVIDGEVIGYSGIRTSGPPYGLTGPFQRALHQQPPDGRGPQDHAAGAAVGHLAGDSGGRVYIWDLPSGGVEQWCRDIAATLDAIGVDYIYTDSLERTQEPAWFVHSFYVYTLYQQLTRKPLWIEASSMGGTWSFPLIGATGQIDYRGSPADFKREVDRNAQAMLSPQHAFHPLQLGWARPSYSANQHIRPDDLEYLLARSLAYDVPVVLQVWFNWLERWPLRDANLELIRRYEQVRLAGTVPRAQRRAAQRTGKDFMLFDDPAGSPQLVPVSLLPVTRFSRRVRAFLTDVPVGLHRYATLWPTTADDSFELRLSGLEPEDLRVTDHRGQPVTVRDRGAGLVGIPIRTRVYIELTRVPNPRETFANATLTD